MVPLAKTSLCRFSRAAHYKSRHWSPASGHRNFMRKVAAADCGLFRSAGTAPHDMALRLKRFRAIVPAGRNKLEQGRHRAGRAILAVVLLCIASALGKARAAEPSEETIARGKAMSEAADCASCHTADPSKPFAGGKRIDTPFGGIYSPNLTPDRDTGIGAWSDREFHRALRFGETPGGSRYYPAFSHPHFTNV